MVRAHYISWWCIYHKVKVSRWKGLHQIQPTVGHRASPATSTCTCQKHADLNKARENHLILNKVVCYKLSIVFEITDFYQVFFRLIFFCWKCYCYEALFNVKSDKLIFFLPGIHLLFFSNRISLQSLILNLFQKKLQQCNLTSIRGINTYANHNQFFIVFLTL